MAPGIAGPRASRRQLATVRCSCAAIGGPRFFYFEGVSCGDISWLLLSCSRRSGCRARRSGPQGFRTSSCALRAGQGERPRTDADRRGAHFRRFEPPGMAAARLHEGKRHARERDATRQTHNWVQALLEGGPGGLDPLTSNLGSGHVRAGGKWAPTDRPAHLDADWPAEGAARLQPDGQPDGAVAGGKTRWARRTPRSQRLPDGQDAPLQGPVTKTTDYCDPPPPTTCAETMRLDGSQSGGNNLWSKHVTLTRRNELTWVNFFAGNRIWPRLRHAHVESVDS